MIAAITVTYNSSQLLEKNVQALLRQSVPVEGIVIVDNHSAPEHQEKIRSLAARDSRIRVLWLPENTGGAGGFSHGMAYVREQWNPDWYWLMDDDAYPADDCLAKLLDHRNAVADVGCLAPMIFGIDRQEYQLYHHKKLSPLLTRDIPAVETQEDMPETLPIEADAFVGPLFSRQAVDAVGIADGSLFIYGDDLEYTYRVSRHFPVLLVRDAVIYHRDPLKQQDESNPGGWWKDYYMFRNRIFFIKKYQEHLLLRAAGQLAMVWEIGKRCLGALVKEKFRGNRKLRLWLMLRALQDGWTGKTGKTIDPASYFQFLEKREKR